MKLSAFSAAQLSLLGNINAIALNHVSHALATLFNDDVWVSEFTAHSQDDYMVESVSDSNYYVLLTDLVGNIEGQTCAVVSPINEQKICEQLLPNSTMGQEEMREGVLLELDNILVASWVTKYANLFYTHFNGNPPSLQSHTLTSLNQFLGNKRMDTENSFFFKAQFSSFKYGINIDLWVFFNDSIKPHLAQFNANKSYVGTKNIPSKEQTGGFQGLFKKLFN